jgi:hypothetical protein
VPVGVVRGRDVGDDLDLLAPQLLPHAVAGLRLQVALGVREEEFEVLRGAFHLLRDRRGERLQRPQRRRERVHQPAELLREEGVVRVREPPVVVRALGVVEVEARGALEFGEPVLRRDVVEQDGDDPRAVVDLKAVGLGLHLLVEARQLLGAVAPAGEVGPGDEREEDAGLPDVLRDGVVEEDAPVHGVFVAPEHDVAAALEALPQLVPQPLFEARDPALPRDGAGRRFVVEPRVADEDVVLEVR